MTSSTAAEADSWAQADGKCADQSGVAKAERRMMHGETICLWCAVPVTLRRGGSPKKKFCSTRCRHEFHSCARRWAEAAVAAGALSIDVLKNGGLQRARFFQRPTRQRR
jgi:hypothetical protein